MRPHFLLTTLGVAALLGTGCERKTTVVTDPGPIPPPAQPLARTKTFETHALRKAIDAYELEPSVVQSARVKKAFAEIDGEIAELVEHVAKKDGDEKAEAARKLADLQNYRDGEQARFIRLESLAPLSPQPIRPEPRQGTAEKVGEAIDRAARKLDDKARDAADAVRDKLR